MSNLATSLVFLLLASFLVAPMFDLNFIAVGKYFLAQAGSFIGVTASVPPNPHNIVAQQLKEKEDYLNQREMELAEREKMAEENSNMPWVYIAVGSLSLLVCVNFILDFKRRKSSPVQ